MYWVFDIETRAEVSVVDRGLAAHAADPETDLLTVCALDVASGDMLTWRGAFADGKTPWLTDDWDHMEPFLQHIEAGGIVIAHNEAYDRTVWNEQAGKYDLPKIRLEQSVCSAAWLRQFNLPSKLGDVSKRLLPAEKAKLTDVASGIKYIWSKKNPLVSAEDVRANDKYCEQDVTAVADLLKLVPPPTQQFMDEYHSCARMNDRGICVDLELALAAQTLKPRVERQLVQEIARICGPEVKLRGPSFLKWLQDNLPEDLISILTVTKKKRVGYEFKSEKKVSADKAVRAKLLAAMEDRTDCGEIREAINAFDEANRAAVGKYKAMLKVEHNGVVYNQFVFSGAAQTGRASSHGIQLQNTIRNVPKNAGEIIYYVKELQEHPQVLENKIGMPVNVALGRIVRPTLMADTGNSLAWSDWSAIEARMLPWLSGDVDAEPLLDIFRTGGDVYVREAAGIYKVPESDIADGLAAGRPEYKEMRQVGKVAILACIAEGQKVLTNNGLRAIEDVRADDLLWDGVEWVSHGGVVFKGIKEVIEYDGITATPDHIVFTEQGEQRLDVAAKSGAHIIQSGAGRSPIWVGDSNWARAQVCETEVARGYGSYSLRWMWRNAMDKLGELNSWKDQWMSVLLATTSHTALVGQTADGCEKPLRTSVGPGVGAIWRAWDSVQLSFNTGSRSVDNRQHRLAEGQGIGSHRQQRSLRTWKHSVGYAVAAASQSMQKRSKGIFNRMGQSISRDNDCANASFWHDKRRHIQGGRESGERKKEKLARYSRTFDILNAGPRNRFTVEGRLVHNCGYQGGVGAFQAMAKAYGLRVSDERADEIKSAWRQSNPWAPRLWRDMESAAMRAVRRPGEPQTAGRMQYIFAPSLLRGTLLLFLPSGRFLAYPEAAIKPVTKFDEPVDSLVFVHPEYGPSSTYGGALVENATQGEAASLLRAALVECDKAGLESIGQVHDEIIIEHATDEIESRARELVKIMETPPEWADGLPLDAEAEIGLRYKIGDALR